MHQNITKKKAFYSHTNLHIGVCWFFWPLFNKGLHITKLIPGAFWEKRHYIKLNPKKITTIYLGPLETRTLIIQNEKNVKY